MSRAIVLCNDASLHQENGNWQVHGDPMEAALLIAGLKADLDIETEIGAYPRTDILVASSVLILVELEKAVIRRMAIKKK